MNTHDVEPTARWVPYYSPVTEPHVIVSSTTTAREDLVAAAGDHIGRVIRDMYNGIAFWNASKSKGLAYSVFSHEGDELGSYTTMDVQYAVNFMKRHGIPVGKLTDECPAHPGLSFSWQGWFTWGGLMVSNRS